MKRNLLLTALVLFTFIGLQAQTLEQVLEKHFQATGQEKISDIKTFYVKMKMSMMGMDMPMTIQVKKPNKFRSEVEVMGQKIITGFDGENGWMKNPMAGAGITDLKGAELKQAMTQADQLEGELYNYAAKGKKAELIGKVSTDGKDAFRIKLTDADGQVKDYYLDANTYLLSKMKARVESMGQSIDVETKVTEYKEIDGMKFGCKMEVETPMGTQSMVIEDIKLDGKMDDSLFARPSE